MEQEADRISSLNETEEKVDDLSSSMMTEVLSKGSTSSVSFTTKSSNNGINRGGFEATHSLLQLSKPQQYGFQRLCNVKKHGGQLVNVHYKGPQEDNGRRRILMNRTKVGEAIRDFEQLRQENFCFKRVKYHLPPDFEVEEILPTSNVPAPPPLGSGTPGQSIYTEFIIEKTTGGVGGTRMVSCKLCGKDIRRYSFSAHMKRLHLPDVTCPTCGRDFRPMLFTAHVFKCVSDEKVNMKQVSVNTGIKEEVKLNFSSATESSNMNDNVIGLTPKNGDMGGEKVFNGLGEKGIKNADDSVEKVEKACIIVKLVTLDSPSKTLKLSSHPDTKFNRICKKFMKRMQLTNAGEFIYRQGDRELTGEEMVKHLSEKPVMVERKL